MKILAVKLRAIGDTVIWTAALESLRQAYSGAEIHTLTYATNRAVLEANPTIHTSHELHSSSRLELIAKLFSLRREKFDWLLGFHATTSLCRWAWLTGAQQMVLHHHSRRSSPRGSLPVSGAGRFENAILRDHRVLEAMGINRAPAATQIYLLPEERARAHAEIMRLTGAETKPFFAFLPGAGHHLRRYPKDLWLPLATRMRDEGHYQPLVIVDRALSLELNLPEDCAKLGLPLFDSGSLREFMAVVSICERALANDSGPGHIAVALGLKTDFVFGPGCVGDWHPYNHAHHPLHRIAVSCRYEGPRDQELFQYCTVDVCDHHRCMRENRFHL